MSTPEGYVKISALACEECTPPKGPDVDQRLERLETAVFGSPPAPVKDVFDMYTLPKQDFDKLVEKAERTNHLAEENEHLRLRIRVLEGGRTSVRRLAVERREKLNEKHARIQELEETLRAVLGTFYLTGHPGYEAKQTGWVRETTLDEWHKVLRGGESSGG